MAKSNTARLPLYLKPNGRFALTRLGRGNDGGYVVDERDVAKATKLISLGVNDEWSFERDFVALRNVPLHAYDGSVSRAVFARRVAERLVTGGRGVRMPAQALLNYGRFFSDSRVHHRLMVGFSHVPGSTTLADIFEANTALNDQVFLKIDIEGYEYRILQDIITYADRVAGLAIEFHDFDMHQTRVRELVAELPLQVAHVHCNNCTPIGADGTPLTIEVTFSSQQPTSSEPPTFPHALDAPNSPRLPEFEIVFDS